MKSEKYARIELTQPEIDTLLDVKFNLFCAMQAFDELEVDQVNIGKLTFKSESIHAPLKKVITLIEVLVRESQGKEE